jgi:hypothetical protein
MSPVCRAIGWKTETIRDRLAQTLLETAPYLIIVFRRIYEFATDGKKKTIITFRRVA